MSWNPYECTLADKTGIYEQHPTKKKKKKRKAEPKHFPFNTYFIKKSKEGFSKINSKC